MDLEVTGEVWHWRGPAPHHFVTIPHDESVLIDELAPGLTYGWGAIPVSATVGATHFTTSIFPRDGAYVLPLKQSVRLAEGIEIGDVVSIRVTIGR